MFMGIIEEMGKLLRSDKRGQAMVLTISAKKVLEDVRMGDSISVNGVCHTVTSFDKMSFTADVMPEKFRKTNLSRVRSGASVNLERAMRADGRFGGHIVQGHVDSTGTILSRTAEENAVVFVIESQNTDQMKYMLPGGSITIDGISLTLVSVHTASFSVSIIPHTLKETVLQDKYPGDTVNIECDVLGKYVERLLGFGRLGGNMDEQDNQSRKSGLSAQLLTENGYI